MKPWEELLVKCWEWCTRGRRRYLSIPLLLMFIVIPSAGGLIESYSKVCSFCYPLMIPLKTELSADERDLLEQEEWGLVVCSATSQTEADKKRDEFKKVYLQSKHKNAAGQPIWENDLLVVRDPREKGKWLVAIDMYPGPSSREELQTGVIEMIETEKATGVRGQPLERWLNGSAPYHFTRSEFEKHHGRILNLAPI